MQSWKAERQGCQRIGVLLFERFSNHCLANTIEPLRAANTIAGKPLYEWTFLTLDGAPVTSSSGLEVRAGGRLSAAFGDSLVVMPSYGFRALGTSAVHRGLRAAAGRFETVIGMDTGAWLMADAGLLEGRRATIHWEELDAFAEAFPQIDVVRARHVADETRPTCSGALAAFELVTELIGQRHGKALQLEVRTLFMAPESRTDSALPGAKSALVARAITVMQQTLETPLSIGEVALQVGRSQKDLELRMKRELGATPQAVYRRLRLILARKLVTETALSVAEIAVRTGYLDASAMTRAFRAEFGTSPRAMRRNLD